MINPTKTNVAMIRACTEFLFATDRCMTVDDVPKFEEAAKKLGPANFLELATFITSFGEIAAGVGRIAPNIYIDQIIEDMSEGRDLTNFIVNADRLAGVMKSAFGLAAAQSMASVDRPTTEVLATLRNRKMNAIADILSNPAGDSTKRFSALTH